MNCRGVPQGVRMDASALRRGSIVRQVLAQRVTHAESGERSAVGVTKHGGRCRIRVPRRLAHKEIPKQPRGSWPQGTEADLVAFAVQAYLLGRLEPQIAQPKVEDLLDPRPEDQEPLGGRLRGVRERLGLVEEPALIGGRLRGGGLLRGATEELRLEPAVLFLKKLDALRARHQASRDRRRVGGGGAGDCTERDYNAARAA